MWINTNKIDLSDPEGDISKANEKKMSKPTEGRKDGRYTYRLANILDINEEDVNRMCERYPDKTKEEILNERENRHKYGLARTIDLDDETINYLSINYPKKTKKEIVEALRKQRNYDIVFFHKHEGISEELIRKYLLLDEYDSDVVKVTLETPESHDCNLIKLTPDLKEKAYRGYRGERNVVSHLIDKENYPQDNKTNKLTIVGKREWDSYFDRDLGRYVDGEPYFFVITAFWGDGSGRKEIKDESIWRGTYDDFDEIYNDMEFWMNHALIPENDEYILKREKPSWVGIYEKEKQYRNEKEKENQYRKAG